MRYQNITVEAARTREAVEASQCDVVRQCDTMKEAKTYARRALTDEFMRSSEASEPNKFSRVIVDGEVIEEFWR